MLVDYFVELSVAEDKQISTLEMKKMFHQALKVAPVKVEPPITDEFEEETDRPTPTSKPIIKEAYLLGHFKLDPVSTDFIGNDHFLYDYSARSTYCRYNVTSL